MATLDQILLDIAPQMATLEPAVRQRFLNYASAQVAFGTGLVRKLAIANLAAHNFTKRSGIAGAVTSEREGDLSRNYGSGVADLGGLGSTAYGQEFMRIRDSQVFAPRIG